MTNYNDLVKRLRDDGCTTKAGEATDVIDQLRAENAKLRAHLTELHKAASKVSAMGAVTGSQWTPLTIALLKAKEALK